MTRGLSGGGRSVGRTLVAPVRFGGSSGNVGCAGFARRLADRPLAKGCRGSDRLAERGMQVLVSVELVGRNRCEQLSMTGTNPVRLC